MNAFLTFLEMKVILGKWNIEYDEILKKTSEEDLSSDMSDFYFEKQEKILSWIEEKKKEFDLYGFKKASQISSQAY